MIIGLGMDLMDIGRIERALERHPRFIERVYSPTEQHAIQKRGAQTAAGYFAAKEAVAKALGTGFRGFSMRDISIEPDALGCPQVCLQGGAQKRLEAIRGGRVLVSITHVSGMAAAVAVIEEAQRF